MSQATDEDIAADRAAAMLIICPFRILPTPCVTASGTPHSRAGEFAGAVSAQPQSRPAGSPGCEHH